MIKFHAFLNGLNLLPLAKNDIDFLKDDKSRDILAIAYKKIKILLAVICTLLIFLVFLFSYTIVVNQIETTIKNNAQITGVAISNDISKYAYYGLDISKIKGFDQEIINYFAKNPTFYAIAITNADDEIIKQFVQKNEQFNFQNKPNFVFDYYSTENKEGEVKIYLKDNFFSYILEQIGFELIFIIFISVWLSVCFTFWAINSKIINNISFILNFIERLKNGNYSRYLFINQTDEIGKFSQQINQFVKNKNEYFIDIIQETNEAVESQIDPEKGIALTNLLDEMNEKIKTSKLGHEIPEKLFSLETFIIPLFLIFAGFGLMAGILPTFIINPSQLNWQIHEGSAIAIMFIGFIIMKTIGQQYTQILYARYSPKSILICSLFALLASCVILYYANNLFYIILIRVFMGLSFGIIISTIMQYINNSEINPYNHNFSYKKYIIMAFSISPLLGGIIADNISMNSVFIIMSGIFLFAIIYLIFIDLPTIKINNINIFLRTKNILSKYEKFQIYSMLLSVEMPIKMISYSLMLFFMPLYLFKTSQSFTQIGLCFCLYALGFACFKNIQNLNSWNKLQNANRFIIGILAIMIGIILILFHNSYIYYAVFLWGVSYTILSNDFNKTIMKICKDNPEKIQACVIIKSKTFYSMSIICVLISGLFYDFATINNFLITLLICLSMMIIWLLFTNRHFKVAHV